MLEIPADINSIVYNELTKVKTLPEQSAERNTTLVWADHLLSHPWTKQAPVMTDIEVVSTELDRTHWGLPQVKGHVLEYAYLDILTHKSAASPLCLSGPPGTGKTTIVEALAKGLGRPLQVISLNGMHDVSELKGHRRTYASAQSGRIAAAIHRSGVCNPIILLDEVDKCAASDRFNPADVLLDILDPSLQKKFSDHYYSIPIDLSKVWFIATANNYESLPSYLRDRFHNIVFREYSTEERYTITECYILPSILNEMAIEGLGYSVTVDPNVLTEIVKRFSSLRHIKMRLAELIRHQLFLTRHTSELCLSIDSCTSISISPSKSGKPIGFT